MKSTELLAQLRQNNAKCEQCGLSPFRCRNNNVVTSSGPVSTLTIVGEAPGAEEDESGQPFVGKSGRLLDKMLQQAGLKREQIFITNVVKCRPYKTKGKFVSNRTPTEDEILACDWIDGELDIVQPTIVIALGKTAFRAVFRGLPKTLKLGDYVGKKMTQDSNDYVTIPCYHPSYLMQHGKRFFDDAVDAFKLAKAEILK